MNTSIIQDSTNSLQSQVDRLERQYSKENKVGCGWLRFTTTLDNLHTWRDLLSQLLRGKFSSLGKGWNGYTHSERGPLGATLAYSPVITEDERRSLGVKPSDNEGWLTVDIPQTAMDFLKGDDLLNLYWSVIATDGKITRFDAYYDDYNKIISPEAVHHACKLGGVGVPRYRNMRGWDEYNLQAGRNAGYTVYFGSNKSEKQIRFYDKEAESGGKQCCYRWEAQFNGQYAEAVTKQLAETMTATQETRSEAESLTVISNWYKALIKGAISFHDIPIGVKPSELPRNWAARSPVCWWWDELLQGLEPAKLVLNRVEPSLQRMKSWLERQVFTGLALYREACHFWGMPFTSRLHDWLDSARERWGDRHLKMLDDALITSPAY